MGIQGRRARLLLEYEKLINLEKRSEFIQIQPLEVVTGMPPEKYVVTFSCLGIASIKEDKSPQFAEFHQVLINLSRDFPNQEPYLKWMTPIWHPNIEHKEPNHVCTNNVQNWFPSKSLDDLVVTLGEMVQYRHYHAQWTQPWPLDKEAADWVVKYAEPQGLIGRNKPLDSRQLLRPLKSRLRPKPVTTGRLKLGVKEAVEVEFQPSNGANTPRRGIGLGVRSKEMTCVRCGKKQTVAIGQTMEKEFLCADCRR